MTDDQFKKAKELKERIEELYSDSSYLYNAHLTNTEYESFIISGLCSDGVADRLFEIPEALVDVIKDWYSDKILRLEAEFEKL